MIRARPSVVACAALAALACVAKPAPAASLQRINDFGSNPSGALMYIYVPDQLVESPPILVALHYCTGTASAFSTVGYNPKADQYGFIIIYPEALAAGKCWDVHSDATLRHGAGGDSASIVSMVTYAIDTYDANASRVYVTGTSSGAMMTQVLLGAYPDVFRGGAPFAGVPYGCFAGASEWNSACADGQTTKTGQQWGDLVRGAYPGYTGPRPRVQLWHGSSDETLNFVNFGEAIEQWTNVLGVSETPTSTEQNQPRNTWVRTRYTDGAGIVQVEAIRETGQPHSLQVVVDDVIRFFGLDGSADPGGAAGGGGAGGAATGGAAGMGDAGAGGIGGASGSGSGNAGASGTPEAGGANATGGTPAMAGSAGTMAGTAGTSSGTGGIGNTAGTSGGGNGGTSAGIGGTLGSGTAGTSSSGSAGTPARGGSAGSSATTGGTAGTPRPPVNDEPDLSQDSGCQITGARPNAGALVALLASALALFARRRRVAR